MSDTKTQAYNLIRQFTGQANTLTIPRPFISMTGSLESALLLSQIIYWSDRATMKDGWFCKSYPDWEAELTLSQYQVSKAIKTLKEFGVETKLKKFNDIPTLHYRINTPVFLDRVMKFFNNPGDIKKLDTPLTETTEPTNTLSPDGDVQQSTPQPKPKTERAPNPLFDAVALGSFGISKVNGDKTVGAMVGKILKWLKEHNPDTATERIEQFYEWYADENNGANAPRDAGKFAMWWLKFEAQTDGDDGSDPFAKTFEGVY